MQLRPFEENDRPQLLALWRAAGLTRPWNDPDADIDRAVAHDASAIHVALSGSDLVGSVMCGYDGHRGWVYYLAAAERVRRQGIAARLMQTAEDWLRERGCPKVELMVRDGNDPALAFYAALGYASQPVTVQAKWLIDPPVPDGT